METSITISSVVSRLRALGVAVGDLFEAEKTPEVDAGSLAILIIGAWYFGFAGTVLLLEALK